MTNKDIVIQFCDKAIKEKKDMIVFYYNYIAGQTTYQYIENTEIKKTKEKIEKFFSDNLKDLTCDCKKIINFYIIKIEEKGVDYI